MVNQEELFRVVLANNWFMRIGGRVRVFFVKDTLDTWMCELTLPSMSDESATFTWKDTERANHDSFWFIALRLYTRSVA